MINEIENKVLSAWQNRRYRQLWQDHKICIVAVAVYWPAQLYYRF